MTTQENKENSRYVTITASVDGAAVRFTAPPATFHGPAFALDDKPVTRPGALYDAHQLQSAVASFAASAQAPAQARDHQGRYQGRDADGALTPERRRELMSYTPLGKRILAEEDAAAARATTTTFATGRPGDRHAPEVLAKLRPDDFADPVGLRHPIVDQQDVDDLARLSGASWLTKAVKEHVLDLCRQRGLDAPLAWLPPGDVEMTPARRKELLGASALGRAMLRGAPLSIGSKR